MKSEISLDRYWRKISEERPCDVCISLTEIYFPSHRGMGNPVWRKSDQGTFGSIRKAMVKKELSSDKNWDKDFCESALCLKYLIISHS